jgi:hypothetical protein
VIASFHLADVGARASAGLMRRRPSRGEVPGLRYAVIAGAARLGGRVLPSPTPGRVGLITFWEREEALERFLDEHPLAKRLEGGWQVALQPTRVYGAWPPLAGLLREEEAMDEHEPAAVLTLGRLRLTHTLRFLRATAAAEELLLHEPALLAATGLARPPALVATFSLWRSTSAMRAYATGRHDPRHRAAIQAHAARPFHHESAFIRFRPLRASGSWDGRDPLADAIVAQPAHSGLGAEPSLSAAPTLAGLRRV